MLQVVTGLALAIGASMTAGPAATQQARKAETIRTEFRVFDGATEVSAETRLRIRPTGSTETGRIVEGGALAADLPSGIYDVQAVRQRAGQIVSVRWAERLVVMAYPDERGRHLEVINFASQHGALQLRWPEEQTEAAGGAAITVSREGESRPVAAKTVHGPGYSLLVLPAGTYDVRIARAGKDPVVLTSIEVPPDRTRMKAIQ